MKHRYRQMKYLYYLGIFCFIFLGVMGIKRSVEAGASSLDEVFSIVQNDKDLTIYYGPKAGEKRVIQLSSFVNPKDDFKAVSFKRAEIAGDNKTVVLEVMYQNCCTSYPISRELFIVQKNKSDQTYFSDMMIYDWKFYWPKPDDLNIAVTVGPIHGNCAEYQLYNVVLSKVIETAECTMYNRDHATGQEKTSPAPLPTWMRH